MVTTGARGNHYVGGVAVNRVARAFSPKEVPVERKFEALDWLQLQRGMQVDVIGRADQSCFAEIRAARKQGIECFQVAVVRISIAAREVRFETEPRFPWSRFKCVAGV